MDGTSVLAGGCHSCSQQRQWVNACWGTCACFRDADFGIMGNQASRQQNNECRGDWWQYSASTVGPWGGGAGQKGTDQCTEALPGSKDVALDTLCSLVVVDSLPLPMLSAAGAVGVMAD